MRTHTHTRSSAVSHRPGGQKYNKKKKERKIEILYLLDRLLVTGHVCGCYQIALPSMPQWPIDTTDMACLLHSVLERQIVTEEIRLAGERHYRRVENLNENHQKPEEVGRTRRTRDSMVLKRVYCTNTNYCQFLCNRGKSKPKVSKSLSKNVLIKTS